MALGIVIVDRNGLGVDLNYYELQSPTRLDQVQSRVGYFNRGNGDTVRTFNLFLTLSDEELVTRPAINAYV